MVKDDKHNTKKLIDDEKKEIELFKEKINYDALCEQVADDRNKDLEEYKKLRQENGKNNTKIVTSEMILLSRFDPGQKFEHINRFDEEDLLKLKYCTNDLNHNEWSKTIKRNHRDIINELDWYGDKDENLYKFINNSLGDMTPAELKKLFAKEKNYTKKDRQKIYDISIDITRRIIPEFKKYFQEKKIEIEVLLQAHTITQFCPCF